MVSFPTMQFLYGDSTPFPLPHNFLATLEAFMAAATRIVQLDLEARELSRQAEESASTRQKGLTTLEQFHAALMQHIQETVKKTDVAAARDYVLAIGAVAQRHVDEHRRGVTVANEGDGSRIRGERERRTHEQRSLLEQFLRDAKLPSRGVHVTSRLSVVGKDAHHEMTAIFENPDGIETVFTLATSRAPAWSAPRRVSEFHQGVDLLVGVEKSWLRGTVAPKQMNLDEWFITDFEVGVESFNLTLRRKLSEKDSFVFKVQRTDGILSGSFESIGKDLSESNAGMLSGQDLMLLERVWKALAASVREVAEYKDRLLGLTLDEHSVFDEGLITPFIVRLVKMFAPTVREIAKRSPNEFELSLKAETDGGRREEIYLKKDQLVSRLQPLSSAGRQLFAPLGLDTWVPGTTLMPPAVAPVAAPAQGALPRLEDVISAVKPATSVPPAVKPVPSAPPAASPAPPIVAPAPSPVVGAPVPPAGSTSPGPAPAAPGAGPQTSAHPPPPREP